MYFDVKWSRWLADTIPGARRRVEFKGARIFFPEERWEEFNKELRAHWQAAQQKTRGQSAEQVRMELDPTICYQALLSRDPRFDGRFFGVVVTTGVYCRPVCRVRPPKPENIRWFACAPAAEAAGFRPCRRCRPEAAPGTSAWLGNSAVVSRALRLISEGAMDETGLEEFSSRLGVSSRHLRRLFAERLGASPLAIASARRTPERICG